MSPAIADYPLIVSDIQVTSVNMDDVLGEADGEGATVTFTPATDSTPAILTLNGLSITTELGFAGAIEYSGKDDLKIVLMGSNIIKPTNDNSYGIYAQGDGGVIIEESTSGGSLDISAVYHGIAATNVTISSGTVSVMSQTNSAIASGNITISGGTVTAVGAANAIVGTVKNAIAGTGWTNTAGTEGKADIAVSSEGWNLSNYKKVQFPPVHTHDDITFQPWKSDNSLPTTAGSYYLTKDVTISSTWNVPTGETNLCLGGHKITLITKADYAVSVGQGATLNLYDDEEESGAIVLASESESDSSYVGVGVEGGTFRLYGGTIRSFFKGVYLDGTNSTFTMTGGTIQNCEVCGVEADGTVTLTGGVITGNRRGVTVSEDDVVFLSGAPTISGNGSEEKKENLMLYGGTVRVTGPLTNTTPIGVRIEKEVQIAEFITNTVYTGTFTSGSTDPLKASDYAAKFASDNPAYDVLADGNELKLAQPAIPYQAASWDSANNKVNYTTESRTDYTVVTSSTTSFEDGKWYVVKNDVTVEDRITVDGTANLILCDGATLTASKGITVVDDYTLNIYGQTNGTGALTIAETDKYNAAIGGVNRRTGGTVNIHGGTVTAIGGAGSDSVGGGAAGIGGGGGDESASGAAGGTVNVYGGTVTATGGSSTEGGGAGIGGGGGGNSASGGSGGTVNIYGGTVTATGGNSGNGGSAAAGIGGGVRGDSNGSNGAAGTLTLGTGVSMSVSADNSTWSAYDGNNRAQYMKVASHIHDGITFNEWTDEAAKTQHNSSGATAATTLPIRGDYYLAQSVTMSGNWAPQQILNLCLNGQTVTLSKGLHISSEATLNLYDEGNSGTIVGSDSVIGVIVGDGTFNMSGGTISGFTTGVQVSDGCTFNMSGGEITGNRYGVDVDDGAMFTVSGGEITGNRGSGVDVDASATFEVRGNPVITDNNVDNGEGGNVYLESGATITVAGALTEGASIGVTLEQTHGGLFTVGWKDKMSGQDGTKYFTSDAEDLLVLQLDSSGELKLAGHEHSFTYAADGATITAECAGTDEKGLACPLSLDTTTGKHTATLTIAAPTLTAYGQTGEGVSAAAAITDENSIKGEATVSYYAATKDGETYTKNGNALGSAPTGAGDYVAEITVGGKTAFVGYTISKTAQAAPTGFKSTSAATPYAEGSINDGSPAISTTNLQVSSDGGKTWADVTQFPVNGKPGIYQFKYKETDGLSESPVTSVLLEATNELREVKITSNKTDANLYKSGETNTLTAKTNTNVAGLTLEYAWYREGVTAAVGTDESYTLQAADVGKKLTVVVTDKTEGATEPYTRVSTATPVIVTVAPTTYQVTGKVTVLTVESGNTSANVPSANVELRQGNTVYTAATTDSNGDYSFTNVPNGEYNIVVTNTEGKAKTERVVVKDANQTINVVMPYYAVSSKVVVSGETPAAVVAGLDAAAVDNLTAAEKASGVTTTMTMEIESTDDLTARTDDQLSEAQKAEKAEQQAIKAQNTGASKSDTLDFIDMSVYKRTQKTGESAQVEDVHNLNNVLEILLPYTTANRSFNIFRYHGTAATKFTQLPSRPTSSFVDGRFYVGTDFIAIYTSGFSTYAIGYAEATTPTYSTGGGAATYAVTVNPAQNGSVSASHKYAASGAKVTITVKPDAGYAVDTVTVTDANGKSVSVTKTSDTTFTFTMPTGKVTVNATFTNGACPQDATCPVSKFTDADAKAWYHDGVHWALDNDVMEGVSPKYFSPNGNTTRAMVATMLWRLEGSPVVSGEMKFVDVAEGTWYTEAVRWAASVGIISGSKIPAETTPWPMGFRPNDAVTREQLAAMLYRYAQYKKQDASADTDLSSYNDAQSVSGWATSAMQWAVGSSVISGTQKGTRVVVLDPQGSATRAQVATMLMRYSTAK